MDKIGSNNESFVYISNYNFLNTLKDFTICFWLKSGATGTILTFVDNFNDSNYDNHNGFTISYDGCWCNTPSNRMFEFRPDYSKFEWSFYEYTFKKIGNEYSVKFFYQGEKKYSGYLDVKYLKKSYIILGAWSYLKYNYVYGFNGYMYDFSIYDEILHTKNYNELPEKEMNYKSIIRYVGMEKENNLYGMI